MREPEPVRLCRRRGGGGGGTRTIKINDLRRKSGQFLGNACRRPAEARRPAAAAPFFPFFNEAVGRGPRRGAVECRERSATAYGAARRPPSPDHWAELRSTAGVTHSSKENKEDSEEEMIFVTR